MSKTGKIRLQRIAKDAQSANSDLQSIFPADYSSEELQNLARRFTGVAFHLEQVAQELAEEERRNA